MPSTSSLLMFESAARQGSLAKAAEELCVSTAAVSKQIKALEDQLSTELFIRLQTGVKLTAAGRQYRESVINALSLLDAASTKLAGEKRATTLNVEVGVCFLHFWLLPRLDSFRQQYPDIKLNLIVNNERTSSDAVNGYDVAFFYSTLDASNAENHLLFRDKGLLVASPNFVENRLKSRELRHIFAQPKIMLKDELPSWEGWASISARLAVEYDGTGDVLYVDDQVSVIQAAINDGGVAMATDWHVSDLLKNGKLVQLSPIVDYDDKGYFISIAPEGNTAAANLLVDWLRDQAALTTA